MSNIVTIITDLGEKGFYLGSVKGTLLSVFPDLHIVDITTSVTPFDISEAVYILRHTWHHFPKNTVHLVIVEDRTITTRRILAAEHEQHYIIAPDNGILSLFFEDKNLKIFEINKRLLHVNHPSLPTRLLMACAAARIASGSTPADLGDLIIKIHQKTSPPPVITPHAIRGSVIYIDSFYNAITNITRDLFEKICHNRPFTIYLKRKENERNRSESNFQIHQDFSDVPEGEKVFHFNSAGNLVISINKGKATSLLGLNKDSIIHIEFHDSTIS